MKKGFIAAIIAVQLFGVLAYNAEAGGVAVTKEQSFHSDAAAKPFVYSSVQDAGRILAFTVGEKRFNIEKTTFVAYVEVPRSIPDEIVSDEQIKSLKNQAKEIEEFSKRYAKAAPILEQNLASLKKVVANLDSGKVRNRGVWVMREDYVAEQAEFKAKAAELAKIQMEELEKKQNERRDFEAAQRAKGLVEYRGEWLTPKDATDRLATDKMNLEISKLLRERSIENGVFRIFQSLDKGVLCTILQSKSGHAADDFCYIRDAILTAENETYKCTIYYAGTYSYINKLENRRTVAAYCLNKDLAVQYLKASLGYTDESEKGEGDLEPPQNVTEKSSLPASLAFATAFGSGFFVGSEGHIVTNYHVVKNSKNVRVYHSEQLMDAQIIAVSAVSDLAILKIKAKVKGIPLSDREHESGDEIFALGYPQPTIQGTELKVTKGVISSLTGLNNDAISYQIDAAIQPGNSGGPICNADGKVLGVVVAKLNEIVNAQLTGSISQNVNYAIKSTEVLALLRSKSIELEQIEEKSLKLSDAKAASCLIATD